jgi:AraC-like DNA-binding protein
LQLINVIGVLCVFLLLLLAAFMLRVKTQNKLGNRLFSLFLILTALNMSGWFLWLLLPGTNELEMFRVTFSFLEMPVFYLYVLALCYQKFSFKLIHLAHTVPCILVNLLSIFELTDRIFISLASNIQWLVYILLVGFTLRRFRRIYLQNYTDTRNKTFKWLAQLTLVFFIAGTLAKVKELIYFTPYTQLFNELQILVSFFALTVITWFVLKALSSPELFRGVNDELQLVEVLVNKERINDLNVKQNNSDLEANSEIKNVKEYMQQESPYLDPLLTLQKLATLMQIPSRDLSILINHKMGHHFFDFINRYRIEATAKLLKNNEQRKLTILEILYQVGFNSKSSFNTAFKKQTGLTPTQYRKKHLSVSNQ